MQEFVQLPGIVATAQDLCQPLLTVGGQVCQAVHMLDKCPAVLGADARHAQQHVVRAGIVEVGRLGNGVRLGGDGLRGCSVRLGPAVLQVLEELGGGVGRGAPEEAQAREVKREEREARGDVAGRDLAAQLAARHQREGLGRVELDEQHGPAVVARHGKALRVEAAALQRADQVAHALALHAHLRRQDVVAHLQRDRLDVQPAAVQQGRELAAELAHVHDHTARLFHLFLTP